MNTSFYGGRKGESFIIVKSYMGIEKTESYSEEAMKKWCTEHNITFSTPEMLFMVDSFSKGDNYTEVNYEEYVIIDTLNKNDKDNGKIFKRGYNQNNGLSGAEYIGQIVGPAGPAPHISLTTIDEVTEKQQELEESHEYDYQMSSGSYKPAPEADLVPGKTDEGFNDEIKWSCCSVRDKDGRDTTAYVGFIFPYTVIEYTAASVDPYFRRDNETTNFINTDLVERTDDKTHPFYEKWHISVPKGIKGDTFKNFRVINASNDDNIETYPNQENDRQGKIKPSIDSNKQRQILVYDYYNYDKTAEGELKSIYIGDYNMISGVQLDTNGTLHISYNHEEDTVYDKTIQWIDKITLNETNGKFHIDYNTGKTFDTVLSWINNVEIQPDGSVDFQYVDDVNKEKLIHIDKAIKWIDNITLAPNGTLTTNYNNGAKPTVFDKKIQWINNITLDPNGTLTVKYNNEAKPTVFDKKIQWIDNITLDEDGTLSIKYNNKENPTSLTTKLRWVTDCTFDAEGNFELTFNDKTSVKQTITWIKAASLTDTGKLKIDFNNNKTIQNISKTLTWIKAANLDSNGDLKIDFNNNETIQNIAKTLTWITAANLADNGDFEIKFNNNKIVQNITKTLKWIDSVKLENGRIKITYNTDKEHPVDLGLLKYVSGIEISDTGDLTINYIEGNPVIEKNKLTWISEASLSNTGKLDIKFNNNEIIQNISQQLKWVKEMNIDPNNYHLKVQYINDDTETWHDLGSIKDTSGILVGENYITSTTDIPTIVTELNQKYPTGLSTQKVVTVGGINDEKLFFAFDYLKNIWYYLGTLGDTGLPGAIGGKEGDSTVEATWQKMATNSVWLVVDPA